MSIFTLADSALGSLVDAAGRVVRWGGLAVGLGLLGAPSGAHAQVPTPTPQVAPAVTAEVVAARVQTFYDQTRSVEARFEQHFWSRAYQRTQSSRGRVRIQRPGRIRFDYDEPAGKVVVSTPAGYVYFEPGEGGAPGQFARGSTESASAALGFLTGTARMDRDFRLSLRADSSVPNTDALELRPRRPDPSFRRIVLYVERRAEAAGVVRRVAIEDPDGNWNRFDFAGFQFNRELAGSVFDFEPPEGSRPMMGGTAVPAPVTAPPSTPTAPPATPTPPAAAPLAPTPSTRPR